MLAEKQRKHAVKVEVGATAPEGVVWYTSCSTNFVSTEWINWTAVDFADGVVNWPIGGGAPSATRDAWPPY
jgi:hypothetical protein